MTQVVFRGDCLGFSGYSETNRLYVCGLMQQGINVKLVEQDYNNLWTLEHLDYEKANIIKEAINNQIDYEYIFINRSVFDCFKPYPNAIKTFASTVWECDPFPKHIVSAINNHTNIDEIIVPSTFNQKILQPEINKPVRMVREGLDIEQYSEIAQKSRSTKAFNFLSIFQFLPRKGYDILLEAYFREFNEHDNVSLIIKTSSLNYEVIPSSSILAYVSSIKCKYRKNLNVYVLTTNISYQEMLSLYSKASCYIQSSRAEGYGRPLLEAMASNVPTITTGWGGQTDFCNNDNSYLIDYDLTSVPHQWYSGDFQPYQQWAEPKVEHLQYLMRRVYENYDEAKQKANRAKDLAATYDYKIIGNELRNVLFS